MTHGIEELTNECTVIKGDHVWWDEDTIPDPPKDPKWVKVKPYCHWCGVKKDE